MFFFFFFFPDEKTEAQKTEGFSNLPKATQQMRGGARIFKESSSRGHALTLCAVLCPTGLLVLYIKAEKPMI